MVKFQLRHGNDLLVMDSIKDCDVSVSYIGINSHDKISNLRLQNWLCVLIIVLTFAVDLQFQVNLQEQGMLLRQDEFLVWQGRRKCLRRVFLFDDLVLLAKPRRSASGHDVYVYKHSIKVSGLKLYLVWFKLQVVRFTIYQYSLYSFWVF